MLASLKPQGRMGIVLGQGVLSRVGAEAEIRRKVVEDDLVECVVALPEKIFYNTGSPGCLLFLNGRKPADRKDKVLFIDAAKDFEKLKNMNRLRDEDIDRIVKTHQKFASTVKFSRVERLDKIREKDYNLSVQRYVDVFEEEEQVDVSQVWRELKQLESEMQQIGGRLSSHLKELGYDS
jgi:type I restriction enzyme M protein